jgi:hypothetical protein
LAQAAGPRRQRRVQPYFCVVPQRLRRPACLSSDVCLGLLANLVPNAEVRPPATVRIESDEGLDNWLRGLVKGIAGAVDHPGSIPKLVAEQAAEDLKAKLRDFRTEVRVTLDHVAAIAFYRVPLGLLVERAPLGDLDALDKLLRINPGMESLPWVRSVMANRVKSGGVHAVEPLRVAISEGLSVRQNKLLEVGALVLLLWPWLGRLTANQQRGFLKSLDVPNVPGKEALREYVRVLGVKGLYAQSGTQEPPSGASRQR